jgi:hypothetical protein
MGWPAMGNAAGVKSGIAPRKETLPLLFTHIVVCVVP